jgi:hypothetical protein
MDRCRSPFRALFTVVAFVLATIAPDRASTRDRGTRVAENLAASTTAIPALWNIAVHAVEHAGTPRHTHAQHPWIASRLATLGASTALARVNSATVAVRDLDDRAFTYDATAPPSIVEL